MTTQPARHLVAAFVSLLAWSLMAAPTYAVGPEPLVNLARQRFGELTMEDLVLFRAVAGGAAASAELSGSRDSAAAHRSLVVRADRIVWLCTDPLARAHVTGQGIKIQGATIDGNVDLTNVTIPFPLSFLDTTVHTLMLRGLHTPWVLFQRATITVLNLENAVIAGPLMIRSTTVSEGINMDGADIGKEFGIYQSTIKGSHYAISAENIAVGADMFIDVGSRLEGTVMLASSTIRGNYLSTAYYSASPGCAAISAPAIDVRGSVRLLSDPSSREVADINGSVILDDSTIRGSVISNVRLRGAKRESCWSMASAEVSGSVTMNGVRADCAIALPHASISATFSLQHATLACGGMMAVSAEGAHVGGSFLLRDTTVDGEIDLSYSVVDGNIEFDRGVFGHSPTEIVDLTGIDVKQNVFFRDRVALRGVVALNNARVRGAFQWTDVLTPADVELDLRGAHIGKLWDHRGSWPQQGKLYLQGFIYEEIDDEAPATAESRTDWLKRQKDGWRYPQPFDQAIHALRRQGLENEWRDLGIEKENFIKPDDSGKLYAAFSRFVWGIVGWPIGYGYQPLRAVGVGLMWVMAAGVVYQRAERQSNMAPRKQVCNDEAFSPWIYSLDLFVPFLKLYQEENWAPRGRLLIVFVRLHKIVGSLLTTVAVASMTGLIRT